MQEDTKHYQPENGTEKEDQDTKPKQAQSVKTKSSVRKRIRTAFYGGALLGLAGFLISFSSHFAVLSICCLWGFFIFGSLALDIELCNHGSKHFVAHVFSIPPFVAGSVLCGYLLFWNKHRPPDITDLTYKAVTKLGLKVEEQLTKTIPRHLRAEQKAAIMRGLSAIPKGRIRVMTLNSTDETKEYEAEFVKLIMDAGFPGSNAQGGPSFNLKPYEGVKFFIRNRTNPPPHVRIFQVFKDAGVDCSGWQDESVAPDTVEIRIGNVR